MTKQTTIVVTGALRVKALGKIVADDILIIFIVIIFKVNIILGFSGKADDSEEMPFFLPLWKVPNKSKCRMLQLWLAF